MKIQFGNGRTEYGPGVQIDLTGDEVALAISAYLVGRDVHVDGARTIRINGQLIENGGVYVDPGACVVADGVRWTGRGTKE